MSTQVNTYVMWGMIFTFDEFKDREDFEPYMDSAFKGIHHHDGLCVLADGMNGEYTVIGHVIDKTANYEGFSKPIQLYGYPAIDFDVFERVQNLIGRRLKDDEICGWLVISHYR